MHDSTPIPDELLDPPPRFGVRAVLIAMTVLAVVAAWLAPTLREWEPDRWRLLAAAALAAIAGVVGGAWLNAWSAARARRKVGRPLLWLVRVDDSKGIRGKSPKLSVLPYVLCSAALGLLVAAPIFVVDNVDPGDRGTWALPAALGLQLGMPLWFFRHRRLLRGIGLGPGGLFLPSDMNGFQWRVVTVLNHPTDDDSQLTLRIGGTFPKRITAVVPEDQRTAVETLLAEKLPPRLN